MVRKLCWILLVLLFSGMALADDYPKIDVSGYKKWEYREAQVEPKANYFLGLTHLGGFSPTVTGGPWQERLQLKILAQLSEKLEVAYDIEQQPEAPDKYDIKVSYDKKHELTFGDFTATFSGNEFASTTKYLNGMMITSKDEGYDIIAVPSAKLKSQIQSLTKQKGNNTKGPYSLGHGSIVEGSERVQLNDVVLKKGTDYILDYFEGKITFTRILTQTDEFSYSYEYTNLIDLFFPALTKKDFFGFQGRFKLDPNSWGRSQPQPKEIIISTLESFPSVIAEVREKTSAEAAKEEKLKELVSKADKLEQYLKELEKKLKTAQARKERRKIAQINDLLNKARKQYLDLQDLVVKVGYEGVPIEGASPEAQSQPAEVSPAETVREEEAAGRYRLKNFPIVPFSDTLTYKGVTLKKNEDYVIKYEDGSITLLTSTLPKSEEPLQITYTFKKTEYVEEILPGSGSRGPYIFTNRQIISQSERIYINERLVIRDYDYIIDYAAGQIMFNFEVPNTSAIQAKYRYVVRELPPPPPPPRFAQQLTVGATYLRESAKKGVGSATADYSEPTTFKAADILANDYTIYLSHFPMVPTEESGVLVLAKGGTTLTYGVDYVVPSVEADLLTGYAKVTPTAKLAYVNDRMDLSDGWDTGTIKILTSVEAGAEITATYTYSKSIVGRYSGAGNGSRGPYYVRNYRNIIPGTERVEVWESGSQTITTYTRNSSFEPDAGDTGYFINYYSENPYVTFNQELSTSKNFSVYFQYVPPTAPTGGDIVQELTGFDAVYNLGNVIEFNGNMANSKTDKVTVTLNTIEAAVFTPPTNRASVVKHNTPAVVEGTEKVYVNNYLRNRDIDYMIDYTSGIISFYYITLTSADAVSVEYEYPDPGGFAQVKANTDSAYKYGVKSTLGPLAMTYNKKAIGFDFNPLGGTAIGVGSNYQDFSATYAPNFHGLNTGLSYQETNNPLSGSREFFTRNYSRNYSLSTSPFDLAQVSLGLRNSETRGDPSTAGGAPTARTDQNEYSGSLSPRDLRFGWLSFTQRYDGKLTDSKNFLGNSFSRNKYFHTGQGLGFTERLKLGADYQLSEPYTLSGYLTTSEVKSSWSTSRDLSYDANLDLTFWRLQRWTAYAKLINHEALTFLPGPISKTETKNTTYHTELTPISQLSASYDYNRQETPSVVVQGKNPMSERNSTNFKFSPFSNFSAGWGHSDDRTIHETARESSGKSDSYSADWNVISTDKIRFDSRFSKSDRSATTPSGTAESKSDTSSLNQDYTFTLTPHPIISISPGFTQENYQNTTDGKPLDAQSQTTKCRIALTPFDRYSSSLDYAKKITSSAGVGRPKYNLGWRNNFRIFDWGELIWNLDEEHNQGEVQAGGTLPDLDYFKVTDSYSLNFTVPQDNPILSAVVLTASYKLVIYDNRLPGRDTDDLKASLMTFEGTLNF